jgi:hypothetical protein
MPNTDDDGSILAVFAPRGKYRWKYYGKCCEKYRGNTSTPSLRPASITRTT